MHEDPDPEVVAVTPFAAARLGIVTAALGAMNTVVASFLLGDPFAVGIEDLKAELTGIRDAGLDVMSTVQEACPSDTEIDLDPVADVAVETIWGTLSLAFRCVDLVRRAEVEPQVKARVDGLEESLEALVECLPARMPPASGG